MPSKAFGGKLEEFRNRLDIPIGVADIDMAQVGGELRQFPPHVEARPVPLDEPTSRETVTKILKPWSTTDAPASSWHPQTDGTGHPGERAPGCTTCSRRPRSETRNASVCRSRTEFIALFCVVCKGSAS